MNDMTALAARYGTPLYVYDLARVDAAFADLRSFLPAPSSVYYSLKANPHPDIARRLRLAGAGAEISSEAEADVALRAGFDPVACLYSGPAKTSPEIELVLRRGLHRFSVESADDYRRVADGAAARGLPVECLLRVNPPIVGSGALRMTAQSSQFGIDLQDLLREPEAFADLPATRVGGLHFFPLSSARDEDGLIAQFVANVETAGLIRKESLFDIQTVDLGGGFATPYARPGDRPRYERLRAALESALDQNLAGWRLGAPAIAFESGRYLVGDCGALASRVTEIKKRDCRTFVLLDSGINHLGGMSGLARMLRVETVPEGLPPVGPGTRSGDLVGPLCTPADVLGRNVPTEGMRTGDMLIVPNTGAYGLSASLVAFLSRPLPVEVVVDGARVASASRSVLVRVPESGNQIGEGEAP